MDLRIELPEGTESTENENPVDSEEELPEEPVVSEEEAPVSVDSPAAEEPVQTDGATYVSTVTVWDGNKDGTVPIKLNYTEYYSKAFEVLECINNARAEAGLYPLVMDAALMEAAMLRAGENTIWWAHTRPNGESFDTVNSMTYKTEIIAKVYPTPQQAVNGWIRSSSHSTVIYTTRHSHIGVGCVNIDGNWFWTALASTKYHEVASESDYSDRNVSRMVYALPEYLDGRITVSVSGDIGNMYPGDTAQLSARYYNTNYDYRFKLPMGGFTVYSTDPSVCTVDENGLITCTGPGSCSVVVYYEGYESDATVFSVTGHRSTSVTVTGPVALSGITARLYSVDTDDDLIRSDMLNSSSAMCLYKGTSSGTGTAVTLTFRDVPDGEYKMAVHSAGGYLVLVDTLTVGGFNNVLFYRMRLYGDVDNSGGVDTVDAQTVFDHITGQNSLLDSATDTEEYNIRRLCADVNRDGVINIRDVTQILRRANGLKSCFDAIP